MHLFLSWLYLQGFRAQSCLIVSFNNHFMFITKEKLHFYLICSFHYWLVKRGLSSEIC